MDFYLWFALFWPYKHGKPRLGPRFHRLPSFSHAVGVSSIYASTKSLRVIACIRVNTKAHSRLLGVTYIGIPPQLYTCDMDTREFSRGSETPAPLFQRNPDPGAPRIYATSILRASVGQWTFIFGLLCLCHINMGNQGWDQDSTDYPPSHTRWEFPLYTRA